jgi:glycosyltransferase involved in cell wall biosynthesis
MESAQMNSTDRPLISIVINNYNYDCFLSTAIDSALSQSYPNIEVVVVDDGSTDNSREVISSYGDRIIPVLKSNAGQASSYNEGFKASHGEIICFLDADDTFHPEKVEKIVDLFYQNNLLGLPIIFFNAFEAVDEKAAPVEGVTTKSIYPDWSALAAIRGDQYTGGEHYFFNGEINKVCTPEQVYKFASKYRHIPYIGMPSSNMSISRVLATQVFPLPVNSFKTCADSFVGRVAAILGTVYSTDLTLTQYRIHGSNAWFGANLATQALEESTLIMPDEYLNSKLIETGRKPVFSFLKSMGASGFYRCWYGFNSADDLIKLAFDVITFRLDSETLTFFVKTLARGLYYKLKLLQFHINTRYRGGGEEAS